MARVRAELADLLDGEGTAVSRAIVEDHPRPGD
jgi:hypothetical protein